MELELGSVFPNFLLGIEWNVQIYIEMPFLQTSSHEVQAEERSELPKILLLGIA